MKVTAPEKRLESLWGLIDRQHNLLMIAQLPPGATVLDVGCGYGSLLNDLAEAGFEAQGVDIDRESIQIAQRLFPHIKITEGKVEDLAQQGHPIYDAIMMKDALHHLVGEHDPHKAFAAIQQLLKPGGRIIILDPNPNLVLRVARRLIGHKDSEADLSVARQLLRQHHFEEKGSQFYEAIGIALSGGYVGYRLIPNIAFLNAFFAWCNKVFSKIIVRLGLGSLLCWRYIIWADRKNKTESVHA